MRQVFLIFVALLLSVAAIAGVTRLDAARGRAEEEVSAEESAALFVGIRSFRDHDLTPVKYAVDDAVDLAYEFSMVEKTRLVHPRRVILALAGGEPRKKESREKLAALIASGASVREAGQSDLIELLTDRAEVVGPRGVLIVSFATHGISDEGTQYLLTASSLLRHRETSLTETKVREIVTDSGVPRALILVDACRERLTTGARTGADRRSVAAPLMRAMAEVSGRVVLSAAAAGGYAYDDDRRMNGVFTAAVIDGLRCAAPADPRGFVTVDSLSWYVEQSVLTWIRKNRDPRAKAATQLHCEGMSRMMPLSACSAQ